MDNFAQIQRVVVGFFVALDSFDTDRAVSLVTDDIEWLRESGTVRGRQQMRKALEGRAQDRRTRHLVANVEADQSNPDSARARSDIVVYRGIAEADGPTLIAGPELLLSNVDDLVLSDGLWQIRKKAPTTVFKFTS